MVQSGMAPDVASVLLIVLTVSYGVSFILTPILRHLGRRTGMVDIPNERSLHRNPTPRNGGVAVVLGVLCGSALSGAFGDRGMAGVLGAGVMIAALGIVDDIKSLRAWPKVMIQLGTAAAAVSVSGFALNTLDMSPVGIINLEAPFLGAALTAVWVVGVTNEINFMDGVNGIVSVGAVIAGACYCFMFLGRGDVPGAAVALAILGASAGFVPWNLPSGSIFLGDGGSATLGFLFAFLAVRSILGGASIVAAVMPLFAFLFDASLAIIVRMVRGERFFSTPHRSHLYQRLVVMGWSHVAVTSLWGFLSVLACFSAIWYDTMTAPLQWSIVAAVLGVHCALAAWVYYAFSNRADSRAHERVGGG